MHFHCISSCWEAWISTAPDRKKNKYVKLKLLVTHWNVIMLIPIDKLSNVLSIFGCTCRVGKPSWNFVRLSSVKISLSSLHRDVSMRSIMWYEKKKGVNCVCKVRRKFSQHSLVECECCRKIAPCRGYRGAYVSLGRVAWNMRWAVPTIG